VPSLIFIECTFMLVQFTCRHLKKEHEIVGKLGIFKVLFSQEESVLKVKCNSLRVSSYFILPCDHEAILLHTLSTFFWPTHALWNFWQFWIIFINITGYRHFLRYFILNYTKHVNLTVQVLHVVSSSCAVFTIGLETIVLNVYVHEFERLVTTEARSAMLYTKSHPLEYKYFISRYTFRSFCMTFSYQI